MYKGCMNSQNDIAEKITLYSPCNDTRDAAAFLKRSPRTLRNWRSQGVGPAFVNVGRNVRYRLIDLERWVRDCTERTA